MRTIEQSGGWETTTEADERIIKQRKITQQNRIRIDIIEQQANGKTTTIDPKSIGRLAVRWTWKQMVLEVGVGRRNKMQRVDESVCVGDPLIGGAFGGWMPFGDTSNDQ